MLQLASIHEKAVRLAVHIFAERGVTVAGEAVLILQFVLCIERRNAKKKAEKESS
jgi:hypothetical protein